MFVLPAVSAAANVTLNDNGSNAVVNITGAENLYSYEVVMNYTGSIDVANLGDDAFSGFLSDACGEVTNSYSIEGNYLYVYGSCLNSSATGASGSGNLFNVSHISGAVSLWSLTTITANDIANKEDGNYTAFVEPALPRCGDNICNNGESCTTCSADCGTCPAVTSSGGGGGSTVTEYYSLKIVTPGEITISDKNYIEVPLTISNNGITDLNGINLKAEVTFEGKFTEDLNAVLAKSYIESLKAGKSENFVVVINVNTKKFGKYKLTVFADVTSPKISDWGEVYIELKKVEASEAEQNLIFAEKLINKNPECLEFTEVVNEAKKLYDEGDFRGSIVKLKEAVDACTAKVSKNEQSFVQEKTQTGLIFVVAILTFAVLVLGLVIYIYKKSKNS